MTGKEESDVVAVAICGGGFERLRRGSCMKVVFG